MSEIIAIPMENSQQIETLLKAHRFVGTSFRTNVARNDETIKNPGGRTILKTQIKSDIKKDGPLFDLVTQQHPMG